MNESKLDFLTAPRFWAGVITALGTMFISISSAMPAGSSAQVTYLALGTFLGTLGGQFLIVGTKDRQTDKMAAATIVAGLPAEQRLTVQTDGGSASATTTNLPPPEKPEEGPHSGIPENDV